MTPGSVVLAQTVGHFVINCHVERANRTIHEDHRRHYHHNIMLFELEFIRGQLRHMLAPLMVDCAFRWWLLCQMIQ
jgi:hypothetical protein